MVYKKSNRQEVSEIILNLETPFTIKELITKSNEKGIKDLEFILKTLDELVDASLVNYREFEEGEWKYFSVFATKL